MIEAVALETVHSGNVPTTEEEKTNFHVFITIISYPNRGNSKDLISLWLLRSS